MYTLPLTGAFFAVPLMLIGLACVGIGSLFKRLGR